MPAWETGEIIHYLRPRGNEGSFHYGVPPALYPDLPYELETILLPARVHMVSPDAALLPARVELHSRESRQVPMQAEIGAREALALSARLELYASESSPLPVALGVQADEARSLPACMIIHARETRRLPVRVTTTLWEGSPVTGDWTPGVPREGF